MRIAAMQNPGFFDAVAPITVADPILLDHADDPALIAVVA